MLRDLLIVGAGPVGLACALEAARLGQSVLVLDASSGPGASSRAVGVHPAALAALAASGAGDALAAAARHVRVGEARARGRTLGFVRFDRLSGDYPFVATVPQERTEAILGECCAAHGGTAAAWGSEVRSVRNAPDRVVARVRDASGATREEHARFAVIATGARGVDLTGLRAHVRRHAYRDRYLMADVPDLGAEVDTAVIHLHAEGVLESFPLPGQRRRYVAWERDIGRGSADPEHLGDRLRQVVATRTGSALAASAVETASGFGVRRTLVPRMRQGRIAVIGDAAHEVSPIGGQGMNLGILDAVTLARVLGTAGERDGALCPDIDGALCPDIDGALERWADRRRRAAGLSGRLAAANTRIGRPLGDAGDRARSLLLAAILRSPAERLLAAAYAMRFDPDG